MEIVLTQGFRALIDPADAGVVSPIRWHASVGRKGRVVAMHSYRDSEGRRQNVLMHRLLAGASDGELVDHVNGDPLDNRRENLRIATARQNSANKAAAGKSRFLGVYRSGAGWRASIHPSRTPIHLGEWDTEELAAAAYNRAAQQIHGSFARLNDVSPIPEARWRELIDAKRKTIATFTQQLSLLGEAK